MLPFSQWPDPHDVCEGEYSVMYEFSSDLLINEEEDPGMIEGSLNEFIEWATFLRNMTEEDAPPEE